MGKNVGNIYLHVLTYWRVARWDVG